MYNLYWKYSYLCWHKKSFKTWNISLLLKTNVFRNCFEGVTTTFKWQVVSSLSAISVSPLAIVVGVKESSICSTNLSDNEFLAKCWHTMVMEQAWVRISFPPTLISSESFGWVCSYKNSALIIPKRRKMKAIILNFSISIDIVLTQTAKHDLKCSSVVYYFSIWISLIKYEFGKCNSPYLMIQPP